MSKNDFFEIRADILCNYTLSNFAVRSKIGAVLWAEKLTRDTVDLYNDFIRRHPEFKIDLPDEDEFIKRRFVSSAMCHKMVQELWSKPDLDGNIEIVSENSRSYDRENHYYFIGETEKPGVFFQVPQQGVILNQPIEINRIKYPVAYRFLFAFVFNRTDDPIGFLSFHFEEKFKRNLSEYKDFLFTVEKENIELIGPGKRIWDKWIEDVPPLMQLSPGAAKFKSLFKDERGWEYVIKALSEDEKYFDNDGNFIRTGNDNQSAVSDLIKILRDRKFFNVKISNADIPNYAYECFGIDIGREKVRRLNNHYNLLSNRLNKVNTTPH